MKCPACGTVNSPSYKLCTTCNTPLEHTVGELPSSTAGVSPTPPAPMHVASGHWRAVAGAYAYGTTPSGHIPTDHILVLTARGKLIGLDKESGELIWWNQLTHQDHGITDFVISKQTIFATTSTQMLFSIDYRTGRTVWTAPTTSARSMILVEEPFIFVAHSDDINCYNFHGYRVWSQKVPGMGMARLGLGLPGNVRLSDPPYGSL